MPGSPARKPEDRPATSTPQKDVTVSTPGRDLAARVLLAIVPEQIGPYVRRRLAEAGRLETWEQAFQSQDTGNGVAARRYELSDPAVQLKLLYLRWPDGEFLLPSSAAVGSGAKRLLRLRNEFAHNVAPQVDGDLDPRWVRSLVRVAAGLLEDLDLAAGVEAVEAAGFEFLRTSAGAPVPPAPDAPPDAPPESPATTPVDIEEVPEDALDQLVDVEFTPQALPPAGPVSGLLDLTVTVQNLPRRISYAEAYNRPSMTVEITLSGARTRLPAIRASVALVAGSRALTTTFDRIYALTPEAPQTAEFPLTLDRTAMLDIEGTERAALRIVLDDGSTQRTVFDPPGTDPASAVEPVEVLGPHQWILGDEQSAELAAFVRPQQPEFAALAREAAEILGTLTGRTALDAYQQDETDATRRRTDEIVDAVCRAVHGHGITYANPPPSWRAGTQTIRTAGEVLTDGLGTCLDTSVLLAGLLEHLGLDAQIWLLPGHCFVAVWRDTDDPHSADPLPPASVTANQVDRGALRLIETTLLTGGRDYPGLTRLHEAADLHSLREGSADPDQIVEIAAARRVGIYPLPVRFATPAGTVEEHEYVAPRRERDHTVWSGAPAAGRHAARDEDVPPRVAQWKRNLLDVSLRNKLLNSPKRSVHPVLLPKSDALLGELEDALHRDLPFRVEPLGDASGLAYRPDELEDRLTDDLRWHRRLFLEVSDAQFRTEIQRLARSARTLIEETGANNLYLTFGELLWQDDGHELRSPLILVPVKLTATTHRRDARYRLSLDDTGGSTPNYALLERLRVRQGVELPELAEPVEDEAGGDVAAVLTALRATIAERGLPFRVDPIVRLGIFDFSGYRLWKDLDEDWRSIARNPLVAHLIHTPAEPFDDPAGGAVTADLDDLTAVLPSSSDSSQTTVVADAVAGKTIVVQGPPGTGKSQTITNLIVHAMVEGKKVLFVAEKWAALDVVHQRLIAAGVKDLVLNLHDEKQRPAQVKQAIRAAIDLTAGGDPEGFDTHVRRLSAVRHRLAEYTAALHGQNPARLSFYSARSRELALPGVTPLAVPEEFLRAATPADLDAMFDQVVALRGAADGVHRRPGHPWRALPGAVPEHRVADVVAAALALRDGVASAPEAVRELLRVAQSPTDLERVTGLLRHPTVTVQFVEAIAQDPRWRADADTLIRDLAGFGYLDLSPLQHYRAAVLDGPLDQARADLTKARGALFGKERKVRKALSLLAPWETAGPLADLDRAEHLVNTLLALRDARRSLQVRLTQFPGVALGASTDPLDPHLRAHVQDDLSRLRRQAPDLLVPEDARWWGAARPMFGPARGSAASSLDGLARAWRAIEDAVGARFVVGDAQSSPIATFAAALARAEGDELSERGLSLYSALLRGVEPLRRAGAGTTADAILDGAIPTRDLADSLQRGVAEAARAERATAGRLRTFDGPRHSADIDHFHALSAQLRASARSMVVPLILAHRVDGMTAGVRRRLSDLRREVTGRTTPRIRTLMARYGHEVVRVLPCVLVSPDSVARYIPTHVQAFDIVVFDEASQIPVADAIGAMGRGRSVVVVGDSRQMPPTRFAELSRSDQDEEDEEEALLADDESILGEVERARVPMHWLSWHYRSSTEALIAFSNEKYYDGRLASFPTPVAVEAAPGPGGHGISFVKVDGQFLRDGVPVAQRRTNPQEARAIVADIEARFAADPGGNPSIGVVTFNIQQRNLIERLLREAEDERIAESLGRPDGIFVKNLENVQGDERETILFSVAFSPDASGSVPLNFGPLSKEGGERRLNVAVTRARRQVVVFCSFEPEQLPAERSTAVGTKHLRAYLELARQGSRVLTGTESVAAQQDRHLADVARALEGRGYVVRRRVGLSDFRIDLTLALPDAPDEQLVAVLTDGPDWARRRTVSDRDDLPASVLRYVAGWPAVERVWLPEWLDRRDQVLDRIDAAVQAVLAGNAGDAGDSGEAAEGPDAAPEAAPEPAAERTPVPEPEPVRQAAPGPPGAPPTDTGAWRATGGVDVVGFRAWPVATEQPRAVLDQVRNSPRARGIVHALATDILATEEPVQRDRLCRLIANACGLARVRQERLESIWSVVQRDLPLDRDGFVWSGAIDPESYRVARSGALEVLDVDEIHPREIRNAIRWVLTQNAAATEESVVRRAHEVLGGRRLIARHREALERAYREVLAELGG